VLLASVEMVVYPMELNGKNINSGMLQFLPVGILSVCLLYIPDTYLLTPWCRIFFEKLIVS
jgi:uncharacterized membrane protein